MERVFVVGVGMTKFHKPGTFDGAYYDLAKEAGTNALKDAGVDYEAIEQVAVGYVYGDSTCGNRAAYEIGLTGIPIYNVNNNCATGSTALYLARNLVAGGLVDCAMALGFEKMKRGALSVGEDASDNPLDPHFKRMAELRQPQKAPPAPQIFGNAGREHMERHGSEPVHFAQIAVKNHRHSVNNPYAQFQDEYTLEQVLESKMIYDPLTKLQCCPTSDGAGAAILASEAFVIANGLQSQAIEITGMSMTTDDDLTFRKGSIELVGSGMTHRAASDAMEQAEVTAKEVDVIELHDCFSANELITYEALGLCDEGKAPDLIEADALTYGGQWVVNPSGGLISKGHPLGATGLAQCAELNWQLRGEADKRQVDGASVALQHNLGLGGACVVTVYQPFD